MSRQSLDDDQMWMNDGPMTSPSSTQGEETWRASQDGRLVFDPSRQGAASEFAVTVGTAKEAADYLNRLEAEARAARLAVEALVFLVEFYEGGGNGEGWTLEQVVTKAREALSAIAKLNQGGQHAE